MNRPSSTSPAMSRKPQRIRFTSRRALLFELFSDVVQTLNHLFGFWAGGVRRENEHAARNRGADVGGTQPAFLFQFARAELGEDGQMPAAVFCGYGIKNESAVAVVLNPDGEAAIASINHSGIGDTGFVEKGRIVHVDLCAGNFDDCGGVGAALIGFQMEAKRGD